MKHFLIVLSFFVFPLWVCGQELGKPFIQNYPSYKYRSDGQNWALTQDKRGFIYVGNTSGVLEYDGVNWRVIPTPSAVIGLTKDHVGIIYARTAKDFGRLSPNKKGDLVYESLLSRLDTADQDFGRVIGIQSIRDQIYIICSRRLFRWAKGKMQAWKKACVGSELLRNELYLNIREEGWVKFHGEAFEKIPNSVGITELRPTFMLSFHKDKILAGNRRGLYTYQESAGGAITRFATAADKYIEANGLNTAINLPDGSLVIGTVTGGIVVIDAEGTSLRIIDKKLGLHDNEINELFIDDQHGLWAALGNGISRIEISSPLTRWYDEVGGWTTAVTRFDDKIYAGALGGYVFQNEGFVPLEGVDKTTQSWTFFTYDSPFERDDLLLYGNSAGAYQIIDNKVNPILSEGSVFCFQASAKDASVVYLGEVNRISILRYKGRKNWEKLSDVEIEGEARAIVETEKGIWVSTYNDGIKFIHVPSYTQPDKNVINYGKEHNLPQVSYNRVNFVNEKILFTTEKGIYEFDEEKQLFFPSPEFAPLFGMLNKSSYILEKDHSGNLWVSPFKTLNQPIATLLLQENGAYDWFDLAFRRLPSMETEVIFHDDIGISWIGGSEGLFRFDSKLQRNYEENYGAFVRSVIIGNDSLFFTGAYTFTTTNGERVISIHQPTEAIPSFDYQYNSLSFTYSAPAFDDGENSNSYSYYLEGYQKHWSDWSSQTRQAYTNLSPGEYTFKVKAKNTYGTESMIDTFKFRINAPWYMTAGAYTGYLLLLVFVVTSAAKFNTHRLTLRNKQLEDIVNQRTIEIREQKTQIEQAYQDIKNLSEIGQKITATLSFDQLIETVYQHVNRLVDAPAFGVGIYNPTDKRLEFKGFIENGATLPIEYDYLHDESKLSIWCFKNNKEVVFNDLEVDYPKITSQKLPTNEGLPMSGIYLPLMIEAQTVGVITVQSFKKNAYEELDLSILRTLASYVAIAFANARSYNVITEKNQQITDSIRYAETIQQAVLPTKEKMQEIFPEHFVIWKPKDIVSGDFYWFGQADGRIFLAVVDCTGHGVPGAFMSMIGSALLNEIINVKKIHSPAHILEELNKMIRSALHQQEKQNNDGMDIGLCMIEPLDEHSKSIRLTYSGARTPLYFIKNKDFFELRGDRKNIGGIFQKEDKQEFTNQILMLSAGDAIYLATDGFADQSAPDKTRISSQRLKETLRENARLAIDAQAEKLLSLLQTHQQETAQRDDITILGIRF